MGHEQILNQARQEGLGYVRVLASNDEHTCACCASRNCRVFRIDKITFPWHRGCRCVLVPVNNEAVTEKDKGLREILLDAERWREEHRRGVEAFAEANSLTTEKAQKELTRALTTPTESEIEVQGENAKTLRQSVPL